MIKRTCLVRITADGIQYLQSELDRESRNDFRPLIERLVMMNLRYNNREVQGGRKANE